MKKKKYFITIIVMLMFFGLCACQRSDRRTSTVSENDFITINILRSTGQELDEKFERQMIEEFQKEYPNVTVVYQQMAYSSYIVELNSRLARGNAPDVFLIELVQIPQYVNNNYLENLHDLESVSSIDNLDSLKFEDGLYGLSTNASTMCVTYNKEAFKKARIKKVPVTLREFYEVCERLKSSQIVPIANGFKDYWTISSNLQCDMIVGILSQQPDAITAVCSREETFSENPLWREEFTRFFTRFSYSNENAVETDWEGACEMLVDGSAGMILNGNWTVTNVLGKNSETDLGVFPLPISDNPDDTRFLLQGPMSGWAVYKNGNNVEMAKKFVNFICSKEAAEKNVQICQGLSSAKDVEGTGNEALIEMQEYMKSEKVFYQGNINHNFSVEQRSVFEKTVFQYLVDKNYDVDQLCADLDERFNQIRDK